MNEIEVVSVEDAGYYSDANASGSTVRVTLQRGNELVECDGILIWDAEMADEDTFEEWKELAESGEEGYTYWTR